MNYKSKNISYNKFFFSALLALTLCKLFSKNKEKIFIFNSYNKPIDCSTNINNFNNSFLTNSKQHTFPSINHFKDKSLCIIFSDFLYEKKELQELIIKLKKKEILGYMVQVLDPMEVNFKLSTATFLSDLETNETLVLDKNKDFEKEYSAKIKELEKNLRSISSNSNWKYYKFSTDEDISNFLINLSKNILLDR